MAKRILSPELRAYVTERYLSTDVAPRELVVELKEKFNVDLTSAQLRQYLSRTGLGQRRAEVERKAAHLVSSARLDQIAETRAAAPKEHLERWAGKIVGVADKAIDTAAATGKVRDVSSAVTAANTAVRLFLLCAGIEDRPGNRRPPTKFNFAFATCVPIRNEDFDKAKQAEIAVAVVAEDESEVQS